MTNGEGDENSLKNPADMSLKDWQDNDSIIHD